MNTRYNLWFFAVPNCTQDVLNQLTKSSWSQQPLLTKPAKADWITWAKDRGSSLDHGRWCPAWCSGHEDIECLTSRPADASIWIGFWEPPCESLWFRSHCLPKANNVNHFGRNVGKDASQAIIETSLHELDIGCTFKVRPPEALFPSAILHTLTWWLQQDVMPLVDVTGWDRSVNSYRGSRLILAKSHRLVGVDALYSRFLVDAIPLFTTCHTS